MASSLPIKSANRRFRISSVDPRGTNGETKESIAEQAQADLKALDELCYLMYAENRHSLLVVLQGIDASGKNGTTTYIAKGVNPEGLSVSSFKAPSDAEIEHDYLWRIHAQVPRRGNVGIFNRSHYEEVIVPKVHPEILRNQHLPESIANDPEIFEKRYRQINDFEQMLVENGTVVVKFLLHISKEEQIERFRERMEDPKKHWKFSADDLEKRKEWKKYMKAFQEMVRATSTEHAPWYAIPADRKWYRNWLIVRTLVATLERLNMQYPEIENESITLEQLERA